MNTQTSLSADLNAFLQQEKPSKQQLHVLQSCLNILQDEPHIADVKLLAHMLDDYQHGLQALRPYKDKPKVCLFGSARISPDDPRYQQVKRFSAAMTEAGYMTITGGGPGLMQAANEGAGRDHSFGFNINLPMEQTANPIMQGSQRHINCHLFFIRKLLFLKDSHAIVLAAGGFGTFDEAFEALTLIQTGRTSPVPVILLEAPGDDFWGPLISSWMRRLIDDGLVNQEDRYLLFHTDNIAAAVQHIEQFYSNYHSFRYIADWVLLRLRKPLNQQSLQRLNAEFSDLLNSGCIEQLYHWPANDDQDSLHLPRLRFKLNRKRMSVLPQLIRRLGLLSQQEKTKQA